MSRLYTRTISDSRKTPATTRGHEEVETLHCWGSANDSKPVVRVRTYWNKDQLKPKVTIVISKDVAYEVVGPKGQTLGLSR